MATTQERSSGALPISVDRLQATLGGKKLPGGEITIEPHEAAIGDDALRATKGDGADAHPIWFVIASLRCMGITVQDLCTMADQRDGDALLFGNCRVVQTEALLTGSTYSASARVGDVTSRTTRDGSRLDSVDVIVGFVERDSRRPVGEVVSTYLFKRGCDA